VIRNEENASFSEGNNQGIAATAGDLVLLLNNDVEPVSRGWLGHMVDTLVEHDAAAVGARLVYPRRPALDNTGHIVHPDLTLQPTVVPTRAPLVELVRATRRRPRGADAGPPPVGSPLVIRTGRRTSTSVCGCGHVGERSCTTGGPCCGNTNTEHRTQAVAR
jgi:hypothetical protein